MSRGRVDLTESAAVMVRRRLEDWAEAVRSHDLERLIAYHVDDFVYFDVPPPTQVRGLAGYRDSWPPFFDYIGDNGTFELSELEVAAGDVAFGHAILRVRGAFESRTGQVRLTVGLRRIDGEWWISHEQHSAPYIAVRSGQ
ncbi:MAG TPA: nuclear transport factor 2 family protein [Candidatus Dormibacteraeota bacterium]|nr:nuclear transport factor 2 family protein [Candidatus Dormibacteraeota bacterium]